MSAFRALLPSEWKLNDKEERLYGADPTYGDFFWNFAHLRQDVYIRRVAGEPFPWTDNPIVNKYRFTNPYRASDRVSQFLIKDVIYSKNRAPEDTLFRILLFKIFNKIETWRILELEFGELAWRTFDAESFAEVLTSASTQNLKIYNGAYIMPDCPKFRGERKHQNHLRLLDSLLSNGLADLITQAESLKEVFLILRQVPSFGDFLAFQYAIDINYSEIIDFSEMDFVVAGPGARRGISKVFPLRRDYEQVIAEVCQNQEEEFERRGLEFKTLWGRPLQLIDVQNLFCEVDKYTREAHPQSVGKTRIKQGFRPGKTLQEPFFPPKWGIEMRHNTLVGNALF